jgi:hypothetical protein
MAHGSLCRAGQQFQQLPLIGGLDGKTLIRMTSLLVVKRQQVVSGTAEAGHGCYAADALMRSVQVGPLELDYLGQRRACGRVHAPMNLMICSATARGASSGT